MKQHNHKHQHKADKPQHEHEHEHGHDHGNHHQHHIADYWRRFVISVIVSIPVIILSRMFQNWFGYSLSFPGDKYVLAILSTFIFIYGGYPFLKGLYDEVKNKAIGMMTLIGIAITVAWAYSVAITAGLEGMDFYWEMATLIDIMLIGHYFEMKSVVGASNSLELLVKMMPSTANQVIDGKIKTVSVNDLEIGHLVMVRPGEKVPLDGIVTEGESHRSEERRVGKECRTRSRTNE